MIHLFYNLQLFYWHFLEILWLFIFLVFYVVWGHHMYTVGLETDTRAYFSGVTILISLPTATKIFNWLSTYLLFPILLNRHISVSFCLQEFSGPSHSLLTQIQDFLALERHNLYLLLSCFRGMFVNAWSG